MHEPGGAVLLWGEVTLLIGAAPLRINLGLCVEPVM